MGPQEHRRSKAATNAPRENATRIQLWSNHNAHSLFDGPMRAFSTLLKVKGKTEVPTIPLVNIFHQADGRRVPEPPREFIP